MPIYPALGPSSSAPPAGVTLERMLPRTLLPLDRFARIISYSPVLFSQVFIPGLQEASSCSDPVLQYTWQPQAGGMPGREEYALAVLQAEQTIERALGFSPVPRWYVDEDVRVPTFFRGRTDYGCHFNMGAITDAKHVIHGGVEAWALVDDVSAVTYTDVDGDGYKELATVQVSTTVTDVNEIAVFYPSTLHAPEWEIRPIKVAISGGIANISFSRHLAVQPALLERLDASGVDGSDDANFLGEVDVYRRYNDPSTMVVVEWQPSICDDSACMVNAQTACFNPIDRRNGMLWVHAAEWDAAEGVWNHVYPTWWQQPTRVRVWYRAGLRDLTRARPMNDMSPELERAVAFLALSYLDRELLACEQLRNLQAHWRADIAHRTSGASGSSSFQVSKGLLDNPFGTTRAAVYAWRVVQPLIVGDAVLAS